MKEQFKELQKELFDGNLIKSIEFEYACRYLEFLNLETNPQNIRMILKKHPLSSCKIQTMGWDNLTEMVETVFIYPHRLGNHSIDFKTYLKDLLLSQNRSIANDKKEEVKDMALPKSESYLFFQKLEKT